MKAALKPEYKAIFVQATRPRPAYGTTLRPLRSCGWRLLRRPCWWWTESQAWARRKFDVDGWGIDVLIGGSQKAVMIPPGLSYLSVSERAWAAMETSKNPRYYFDLRKERKNAKAGESAYTPAVALVAALGAALDYIAGQAGGDLEKGRDRADRQRRNQRGGHARADCRRWALRCLRPRRPRRPARRCRCRKA